MGASVKAETKKVPQRRTLPVNPGLYPGQEITVTVLSETMDHVDSDSIHVSPFLLPVAQGGGLLHMPALECAQWSLPTLCACLSVSFHTTRHTWHAPLH